MLKMHERIAPKIPLFPMQALRVLMIATSRDPKQTEPKEVETALLREARVGLRGMLLAMKYHEANTPAAVT